MFTDPRVLRLLGRQHWVATRQQLRDVGLSTWELRHALRNGNLEALNTRVVHLSGAPWTFESRALYLSFAGGLRSYLSGTSAARLHGVRGMPEEPVELTIAQARGFAAPSWARIVRTSWMDVDRHAERRPDGFVVSTPLRTLMRLAESVHPLKFEKAAEDLWHRRLIDPTSAREFLEAHRRSGRGGVKIFEDWLDRAAHRRRASQSGLEVELAAALVALGLPEPERQHPVRLQSGLLVHLDLAYPSARLAIEPGASWWHGGDEATREDNARDRACSQLGWQVLRFDEVELRDVDRCARQVAAVLARRSHVHRPPGVGPRSR